VNRASQHSARGVASPHRQAHRAGAQPIVVIDPDGSTCFANRAALRALGHDDPGELVGRPADETIRHTRADGSPLPAGDSAFMLAHGTGDTVTRDLDWLARRDGSIVAVSWTAAPLDMPSGRGVVLAFSEVEPRAEGERALGADEAMLAIEHASLRRVADLAAASAPPAEVVASVAREVARVLRVPTVGIFRRDSGTQITVVAAESDRPHELAVGTRWPLDDRSMSARVLRSGRPLTIEDLAEVGGPIAEAVRKVGVHAGVAVPIMVNGGIWGLIAVAVGEGDTLPEDTEERLARFTALVATAISNSQARTEQQRLADEQAALRRVATLVAEGASPAEVFAAVAREVSVVLDLPLVGMYRYEDDGSATVAGASGEHPFQPDTNWPLDGPSCAALVYETGRPARMESYADLDGTLSQRAASSGFAAGVGAPIVVDGELWGAVAACTDVPGNLQPDAEGRLSQFTALVATAIANTQAREDLRRIVNEQAALRRLATLVAEGAEPDVVFDAVCRETALVLGACSANLAQFTPDGYTVTVAGWSVRGVDVPVGTRTPLEGESINILVRDTAEPARMDSYEKAGGELADLIRRLGIRSGVGAPVLVKGRVWGALIAATDEAHPLRAGTEQRVGAFAELIATALSNAAARTELLESRVRIVAAGDEQRRRVVRDLHDGAQQRLVHAIITLQGAYGRVDLPEDVRPLVEEGLGHARQAIVELRELAHGIHPETLTDHGLQAAVESLADRAPLPVDVDVPDERYPAAVEAAAYFVTAEALTNVAKYADASTARVGATRSASALTLVIEDDGVGGATPTPDGGLSGLVDRLGALGGELSVASPRGAGTQIRAVIPLHAAR
jgi:signal transduction histidine kinase